MTAVKQKNVDEVAEKTQIKKINLFALGFLELIIGSQVKIYF